MSDVHLPKFRRLLDIVHADQKLYLVFEFLDVDLKRYMENANRNGNPISPDLVKVRASTHSSFISKSAACACISRVCDACIPTPSRRDALLVANLFEGRNVRLVT